MRDLIDELDAVRRTTGDTTLPGGAAKVVALERTYPAETAEVWDAITNPERIPRWFLPVTGDLRLGGTYQLEGNAGGEIRACEPPHRLQVTWIFGEGAPMADDTSLVEVRLSPTPDGGTRLVLEHVAVVPPEMWDPYGPGAVGVGWDLALLGLSAHVQGVELGDPATLDTDPTMRDGMRRSSAAWGRAAAAAGVPADVAAAWEEATTAFYVPPLDGGGEVPPEG